MSKLGYQVDRFIKAYGIDRQGSEATKADRKASLTRAAHTLYDELGYRHFKSYTQLKQHHVKALVNHWFTKELTPAAQKNYMSHLRWAAERIGKANMIPSNMELGIERRQYINNADKSLRPTETQINSIHNDRMRCSFQLQKAFGLRREEALKLHPGWADQGDKLRLKGSWCKGGRERDIPINHPDQRQALNDAKRMAGQGSMIPKESTYKDWVKQYENTTREAGLGHTHGLRHAYAQDRYEQLTGWPSPIAGGPSKKTLSAEDRKLDDQARLIVAQELGHDRIEISANYIGT